MSYFSYVRRVLLAVCGLCIWFADPVAACAQPAPVLWLAPLDDLTHPNGGPPGAVDYMQLFAPDAKWAEALPAIKVFKIYPYFIGNAPDAELSFMIAFLHAHNIKLALEAGALTASDRCGSHVEGYGGQYLQGVAKRIQMLGGTIDYLAMDEPLWFGSFYRGPRACQDTIPALAKNIATSIAAVRAIMPDIQVGDIEPGVGPGNPGDWAETIGKWAKALEEAMSMPPAFVHLDVNWFANWTDYISAVGVRLHRQNIPYGIIYNGTYADDTDAEWVHHAEQHYLDYEAAGRSPDVAIFQTWRRYPTHVLPPKDAETLTNLAADYVREPTKLDIHSTNPNIVGRLTTANGIPRGARAVSLQVRSTLVSDNIQPLIISGIAPDSAVSALFAVRLNAECHCSGAAHLELHRATFRQQGTATQEADFAATTGLFSRLQQIALSNEGSLQIKVKAGQPVRLNSKVFPVLHGVPYTASFNLGFSLDSIRAGFVAIIFLGTDGKEIQRIQGQLAPSWTNVATTVTDLGGEFHFPSLSSGKIGRVVYAGNESSRPADIKF
jgi:hypothetical protein